MKRSQPALLIAAAVFSIAVLAACGRKAVDRHTRALLRSRSMSRPRIVRTIATFYVSLDGQIAPLQQTRRFRVRRSPAMIVAVYVERGAARPAPGELLAKIDDAARCRRSLAQQDSDSSSQSASARWAHQTLQGTRIRRPRKRRQYDSATAAATARERRRTIVLHLASRAHVSAKLDLRRRWQTRCSRTGLRRADRATMQPKRRTCRRCRPLNTARASTEPSHRRVAGSTLQRRRAPTPMPIQNQTIAAAIAQRLAVCAGAGAAAANGDRADLASSRRSPASITQRLLDPGAFASRPTRPSCAISQVAHRLHQRQRSRRRSRLRAQAVRRSRSRRSSHPESHVYRPRSPTSTRRPRRERCRIARVMRDGRIPTVNVARRHAREPSTYAKSLRIPNAIVVPRTAARVQTENGASTCSRSLTPPMPPGAAAAGGPPPGKGNPPPGIAEDHASESRRRCRLGSRPTRSTEVDEPSRSARGPSIITTRPDALQDKSTVAVGGPHGGRVPAAQ